MSETFSLWVVPTGDCVSTLQSTIQYLSSEYNGPTFPPHVTLLPSCPIDKEGAVQKAKELARHLKAYYVSFEDVDVGETYFQCVFLRCLKDEATMAANAAAREAFGLDPAPPYMPHLSLFYSDAGREARLEVAAAARRRLYGEGAGYESLLVETGFWARALAVWAIGEGDETCQSWEKVAEVELQGE